MIARVCPYAILLLALLAGWLYTETLSLERDIETMKGEHAAAVAKEAEHRRAQLQAQADAYGKALAEAQAQQQRLAARNDTLNRQLREVADYASRLADSLRLYLNSMLNYPTDPAGWPALPADPERPADAPAPAAADPAG